MSPGLPGRGEWTWNLGCLRQNESQDSCGKRQYGYLTLCALNPCTLRLEPGSMEAELLQPSGSCLPEMSKSLSKACLRMESTGRRAGLGDWERHSALMIHSEPRAERCLRDPPRTL